MHIADHYIRFTHIPTGVPTPITLDEIAALLCCTPRNAKVILTKMEEAHWITWKPGRGRGNASVLTLLAAPDELIASRAQELVKTGDIRAALSLIEEYAPVLPGVREPFHAWLHSHFGYRVEAQDERRVDTLRLTISSPCLYLDPAYVYMRSEVHMARQLFDTLVLFNRQTKRIEPHIAHSWEANAAGTEWTFYLRKGVLFHHGRPLTAEDVRYTLERMQRSPYRWLVAGIAEMQALDDTTLHVRLTEPNQLFLHGLSNERASIVPAAYCEEMGERFARVPVGTGPFKQLRNDETMIVFEAFAPYFRERAFLDRLELWVLPGLDTLSEPLDADRYELQYVSHLPEPELTPDWERTEETEKSFQYLICNLDKTGPVQHPAFRQALRLLSPRNEMIRDLGGARLKPATGFYPDTERVYEEETCDMAAVRDLLTQSGYAGEVIRLYSFDQYDHVEDAAWLTERCARVGIRLESFFLPDADLLTPARMREADLIIDGGSMDGDEEMSYLDLFCSDNSFLPHLFDAATNAWIQDELIRMRAMSARQDRLAALLRIENRLHDQLAVLPLYRNRISITSHPALRGVTLHSSGWLEYRSLWYKRK